MSRKAKWPLPRQELADRGQVIDRLAADPLGAAKRMLRHGIKNPVAQFFLNPAPDAHQNAGPQKFQETIIGVERHDDAGKGHQRRHAAGRQHPVIDLQHEQRAGQHQNVHQAAEQRR